MLSVASFEGRTLMLLSDSRVISDSPEVLTHRPFSLTLDRSLTE